MTQFCNRCQAIGFNETKYDARPIRTPTGFRLDIPREPENRSEHVQEGYNTGIAEHLSLHVFDLIDSYPHLPQISNTGPASATCNFCSFLKQCLLSKDVVLALADHGADVNNQTVRIGLKVSYSWGPRRTGDGKDVGLDGLYIYLLDVDHGRGVLCVVRCTAYSTPGFSVPEPGSALSCAKWLRLRTIPIGLHSGDYGNGTTSCDSYVSWMSGALEQCQSSKTTEHESCASLQAEWDAERPTRKGNPWMPTGLIDVSRGGLRLVTTSCLSFTNPPKYTALSCCWGLEADAKLQLLTTAETTAARKKSMEFSDLSPLQQDAVTVTRSMNVQYLWIDSLCIVQGDEQDWLKEVTRIGNIYSHAYFTIVSLMPTNQSSFLAPEVPQISIPFQSTFALQSGLGSGTSTSFRLCFESAETHASGAPRLTKLSPNRWVTRGWTLQEQALSRRMFLFGPAGLRFICQSASETPASSEGPPRSILRTIQDLQAGRAPELEGYHRWRDFARDFSGRACTKQADRLPAMAGLASLFGKSMYIQGQYSAGLWRGDLVKGLLWRHMSREPKHQSLETLLRWLQDEEAYVAPSWSWVDRFGITFFCYDDAADDWGEWEEEFKLRDAGAGMLGQDYGPVRGRDLALSMYATTLGSPQLMKLAEVVPRGRREERPFNDLTVKIGGAYFHCMMDWSTATENGLRDGIQQSLEHVQLVLLASAQPNRAAFDNDRAAIGLVVHRKNFSEIGEERLVRIGAFYSEPQNGGGIARFRQSDAAKQTISVV